MRCWGPAAFAGLGWRRGPGGGARRPADPGGELPSRPATVELLIETSRDQTAQLAGRIAYVAGAVASHDFPPTDQMRVVHGILRERLAATQTEL